MIDVTGREPLLTMTQAARQLGVSMATIWRWRLKGVRGRLLETVQLGNKVLTSPAAIQRFAVQSGAPPIPHPRSPRRRERAIRKAEQELEQSGI